MPTGNVLVTGASRGLGLETAMHLAERGYNVWAGIRDSRRRELVVETARKRGVRLETVSLDVTEPPTIEAAVERILERGPIAALVNNAGATMRGYFEDLSEEELRRPFEVNLFGTMNVTRQILPQMRAAGAGRIVMMSSIAGKMGSMSLTAYVASKFALEGFSESLALEVRPLGLHLSIIEPGIVETDIWSDNRVVALRAQDRTGLYYEWFQRAEQQANALVRTATVTPQHVAATVYRALTAKRPRLRYTVGRRAKLVLWLRRHIPGDLFERLYFGEVQRRVTGGRMSAGRAS